MRVRLAFAAITVACLGVVACQPTESGHPTPATDPCVTLSRLPAPGPDHVSGRVMVRDAQQDGATPSELREFCTASVESYPNW